MMAAWFTVNLGDAMLAAEPLDRIKARFASAYMASGRPKDMALFTRHESGRLHCEVKAYFSPAAADIAKTCGAAPCRKPDPQGLNLEVGDEACRSIFFP